MWQATAEDQLGFSHRRSRRQSSGSTGTKPTVIRKPSKRRVCAHERTNASADAASSDAVYNHYTPRGNVYIGPAAVYTPVPGV